MFAGAAPELQYWVGARQTSGVGGTSFSWTQTNTAVSTSPAYWQPGEPSMVLSQTYVKIQSLGDFKYADVEDTAPGYPLCEIG